MRRVGFISSGVVLGFLLGATQASALYKNVPDHVPYLTGGDLSCEGKYCDKLSSKFVDTVNGINGKSGRSVSNGAGPSESASAQGPKGRNLPGSGKVSNSSFVSLLEETDGEGSASVDEILTAVPVPASLPLLLGAFGLAAVVSRRRK